MDLVHVLVAGVVMVTIGSMLFEQVWVLELVGHFRIQLALGSLGLGFAEAVWGSGLSAGLAGVAVVLNLIPILHFVVGEHRSAVSDRRTLFLFNVRMRNRRYSATIDHLRNRSPDLIALVELDQAWVRALSDLDDLYPFHRFLPHPASYGLGILSRFPIVNGGPVRLASGETPLLLVELEIGEKRATILVAHLPPPLDPTGMRLRNQQILELSTLVSALGPNCIVAGDFNITPWMKKFRMLLRTAGLQDFRRAVGKLAPTWPAQAWPLRIPIDHVLGGSEVIFRAARLGVDLGSDHLPVIVEFSLFGTKPEDPLHV
ncbi:MAG: endonuclease/exonuclease/phosphatase family protein [Anaerolineales bacterium]